MRALTSRLLAATLLPAASVASAVTVATSAPAAAGAVTASTSAGAAASSAATGSVDEVAYTYDASTGTPAESWIGVVAIDGSGNRQFPTQEPASDAVWNPAGTLIAFTATLPGDNNTEVKVLDPSTGQERAVTPAGGYHTPVWSPDGTELAVVSNVFGISSLAVVPASGGTPTTLIDYNKIALSVTNRPVWSPDGSQIAVTLTELSEGDQGTSTLAVVNADGTGYHQVVQSEPPGNSGLPLDYQSVVWAPGSVPVFDSARAASTPYVGAINPDGSGETDVTNEFGDLGGYSPDTSHLVAAIDGAIKTLPVGNGMGSATLDTPPAGSTDSRPVYSADGSQVVFCRTQTATGASDLYAVNTGIVMPAQRLTASGQACNPSIASLAPRYAGSTRVATAISASRASYSSAPAVVIARSDLYADALAAAPLAGQVGGPLLLSPPAGLTAPLAAEITRLGAKTAYVIGDTTALSSQVDTDLAAAGITTDVRIGGTTRYDTAAMIAQRVGGSRAYLTLGTNWPDAASVSDLAAYQHQPVLLTAGDTLSPATAAAITALHISAVTIVGGTAAISPAVADQLGALGVTVTRLAGADRWGTSAAVATAALAAGLPDTPWFADGLNWPDAIAAGPAAAKSGGMLLLVHPRALQASLPVYSWLVEHPARLIVAVGGPDVVAPTVIVDARPH